jgi:hypothetical protein
MRAPEVGHQVRLPDRESRARGGVGQVIGLDCTYPPCRNEACISVQAPARRGSGFVTLAYDASELRPVEMEPEGGYQDPPEDLD